MKTFSSILGILGLLVVGAHAQYVENLSWTFESGNLVSNWSFENLTGEICAQNQPGTGGSVTDCRVKSPEASTGNYVLTVRSRNEGVPDLVNQANLFAVSQTSAPLMVEPEASYTFSFKLKIDWSEGIASSRPVVCWLKADKTFIHCAEGEEYHTVFPQDVGQWRPYSFNFTPSADAHFIYFHLVQSDNDGVTGQAGDFFEFDDLRIRKAGSPAGVLETRNYSDAAGNLDHSILNDGLSDVISKMDYDAIGRSRRTYLPFSRAGQLAGAVVVSALDLAGEIVVDYPDVQTAYAAVSSQVASAPFSSLPLEFAFFTIVQTEGDLAPVSEALAEIVAMSSADGVELDLELIGIVRGSPAYLALVESESQGGGGHASKGPFTGNFAQMLQAQYPNESNLFIEVGYPEAGVHTIRSISQAGNGFGPAARLSRSGSALLATPTLPANPEYNGNAGPVETKYAYSWSQNPQGFYTAEIRDDRGLLVKSAASRVANPTSPSDWIVSESAFDDLGRKTLATTPEGLGTSFAYDGMGQLSAYTDPDRGTCDHLYDQRGNLRFKRTEEGLANGYFLAIQYDIRGRVLGKSKVTVAGEFTQASANNPEYPGVAELQEGALYDALDPEAFEAATGTSLGSLGFTPPLRNGQGQAVCSYNRNPETNAPGLTGPERKLVATFNSFDDLGRLEERWKYVGPAPAGKRWHKIRYTYDDRNRLKSSTVFQNETESEIATRAEMIYDTKGRVARILDKDQGVLAGYSYDFREQITSLQVPGPLRMNYTYDIQGKSRSLKAIADPGGSEKVVFQELMGYEGKPHEEITNAVPAPRFDGAISSLVRKFSRTGSDPVEWWQYEYDGTGRMVASSKHLPAQGGALNPTNDSLEFPVTFAPSPVKARDYEYDDDGRIVSQSDGTTAYGYAYKSGSHLLDNVSPSFPGRSTDAAGNFQYDPMGRMREDRGSDKEFDYNLSDRPVRIEVAGTPLHFFYDENGYQVAVMEETQPGEVLAQTIHVYESGLKTIKEIIKNEPTHPQGAFELTKYPEYGKGGVVAMGYAGQAFRHVLVKDHQGSVVEAVATGTFEVDKEQGYLPYGGIEPRVVPGDELVPNEAFTGKIFSNLTGLYYFGARFYDPELGLWLTPDPAGQFFNPYAYGGDPINGTDPDGECFEPISGTLCLAGIIVGGYMVFKGAQNVAHHWDAIYDDYSEGRWIRGTGKTAGVFTLGAAEGGVDALALAYNYTPLGLLDRYSGANLGNDFIFAPVGGTLDYSSHALVYEEWDNSNWSTAIREKAFWYRGGIGGFYGMLLTDLYNMQGEGRSTRERYTRIQRKIDNCIQAREIFEGEPPKEGTAERYRHGFSNPDFPRSEADVPLGGSQTWHKFFGWTHSIIGIETWFTSKMGGAKRNQYYGFEVYGEGFEAWSAEDLRDDTELDRNGFPPVMDWTDYHNAGCAELTGYGFWNR